METQHWLEVSFDCGYITKEQADDLLNRRLSVGKMIGSMIGKSSSFCKPNNG
ncbi:MAG: four helix bundle protein [Cyclobacteriaceae bacterium]